MPAERDEQKEQRDPAQGADQVPALPAPDAERCEHDHDDAEILGVELEEIASPVVLQHAVELGEKCGDDLLRRHGEAGGVGPAAAGAAGRARGIRQVLQERQHLDGRDGDSQQHRRQREPQEGGARPAHGSLRIEEHQEHGPEPRRDQQVVRHLIVRAQHAQPDHEREQPVAVEAAESDGPEEREEHQGRQGRHEELAVVSRPDQGGHDTGELVGEAADDGADPPGPESPEQGVHRRAGEHDVPGEAEVHRGVDREHPAEPRGGIEDVAVLGRDIGQPPEEIRVPLGNVAGLPEHLRPEEPEAVARHVLVVAQEKAPAQHRPAQSQRRQDEDAQRQERRTAWLERCEVVSGRHAVSLGGMPGTGPRPRTR